MSSDQETTPSSTASDFEVPLKMTLEHYWKQFYAIALLDKPSPLTKDSSPESVQRIIRATFMVGAESVIAILRELRSSDLSEEDGAAVLERVSSDLAAYHKNALQTMIEKLVNTILAEMPPNG